MKTNLKRKSAGIDLTPLAIILGVFGILMTMYIVYRASVSEQKLFSISLIALFAGLLFESFRICDNWKSVIYRFIGTYVFSLICFLPGKRERIYDFENHIMIWPYYFIFFYCLATVFFDKEKVTLKLTEGITLLQSLSIIYWIIDHKYLNTESWFVKSLVMIALAFSIFSIIHAFSYFKLSRNVRLILSIWSTIIMIAFAIDNIYGVYQNQSIETTTYLTTKLYIALQFFLLGISAIYITRDYLLLEGFIPSRNGNYKRDLKETKEDHINRYSDYQVHIGHSLLCVVYALIIFGSNYKYKFLPTHTMIWFAFLTFPFILMLISKLGKEKNYS